MVVEARAGKACQRLVSDCKFLKKIADLFFAHLRLKVIIALQFQTFRDIAVKLVEALHITAFEHCSDILGSMGEISVGHFMIVRKL